MLEVLILNYKPLGKILLILIAFLTIHVTIFYDKIREHLIENWKEYRTQPWIFPISGFIKPMEGKTGLETTIINFRTVISQMVSSFLKILMRPINAIMKVFIKIFAVFTKVLQGIRKQINVMRNFLFKLFEKMYIRLQNGMAAIVYFFLKFRESLKKSYGIFNLVINTVEHSIIFFETMMKGPLGTFGNLVDNAAWASVIFTMGPFGQASWDRALCFSPNTPILLNSGYARVLNDIKIGDILHNNNRVIAKIDADYKSSHIYNLYGIDVTGSHLVKYNDKWIRVSKHPDAYSKPYNLTKIICLVTEKGILEINNIIFKDYLETNNITIMRETDKMIEDFINNTVDSEYTKSTDLMVGIPRSSTIYNNDVTGVVDIDSRILTMYDIDSQLISSNGLVLENGKWVRVYNHSRAKLIGKINSPCINFITESEKIILDNGLVMRDFTETNNIDINNKIDNFVENNLC
tara:strand:- start:6005 stop:7393 length:1389 start_codon:yes stop_codon:yes gene_type:complete